MFENQLQFAASNNLPLSLHCIKAFDEMALLLIKYGCSGFMHGFSSSYEQALRFVKLGCMIGINGRVCNPKSKKLRRLVTMLPIECLVLETDYPYVLDIDGKPILINLVASA